MTVGINFEPDDRMVETTVYVVIAVMNRSSDRSHMRVIVMRMPLRVALFDNAPCRVDEPKRGNCFRGHSPIATSQGYPCPEIQGFIRVGQLQNPMKVIFINCIRSH